MKNNLLSSIALLVLAAACSPAPAPVTVSWKAVNLPADSLPQHYRQTITLTGDLRGVSRMAFNQFARRMRPVDPSDTLIEIVPGYYAIGSPKFAAATGRDTVSFDIDTRGGIWSVCYGIDGAHLVMADGSTRGLDIDRADMMAAREGYAPAAPGDRMPYADAIYARNEQLRGEAAGEYDAVPSFTHVELGSGSSLVDPAKAEFIGTDGDSEDFTVRIADGRMTVECASWVAPRVKRRLLAAFGSGERRMTDAVITDSPALEYRGLMIDVARNFQPISELYRVADLMADYNLNTLHFHAVDDEAWRLTVEALPELTEVGSRRGYTPIGDGSFLPQIFAGNGDPDALSGTANGCYTRRELADFLHYTDSLGITVIPEIESPGHGRAAIEAMKYRARRTGDTSVLVAEDAAVDTSRYTSAQSFHDNIMNPALPGTYALMGAFADEMLATYAMAGVPLKAIHIGGDEVPRGAWSGSPAVAALMEREGLATEKDVHAFFVDSVARMYHRKGIPVSGWQEIALRHSDDYNERVRPSVYSVNCWSTLPHQGQGGVVTDIARAGYPVILSNVDHFYLDMTYSYHPYERGLCWGGTVDEFDALHGYPRRLCPEAYESVKGVQGQVFAETIRSAGDLERMLLPKMLGLAERAANPDSTYSDARFNAVVERQMPRWAADGYTFHLRLPGIVRQADGTLLMNSPYSDGEIRYTLDGTNPTASSPLYDGKPVAVPSGATQARAAIFLHGAQSLPSLLWLE